MIAYCSIIVWYTEVYYDKGGFNITHYALCILRHILNTLLCRFCNSHRRP